MIAAEMANKPLSSTPALHKWQGRLCNIRVKLKADSVVRDFGRRQA
jgi:hypothetical protein